MSNNWVNTTTKPPRPGRHWHGEHSDNLAAQPHKIKQRVFITSVVFVFRVDANLGQLQNNQKQLEGCCTRILRAAFNKHRQQLLIKTGLYSGIT